MDARTDEALVEAVHHGEVAALDEMYRRHAGPLHTFCATALDAAEPEDVVHDVFLRVVQRAPQFDPRRASFRAWIFAIARNRCRDAARRAAKVTMTPLEEAPPASVGCPDGGEDATLDRETIAAAIRACLARLAREDERQALVLYHLVGKVYREVGEALGKSTSMAQKLVRQARRRMKVCLTHRGVTAG